MKRVAWLAAVVLLTLTALLLLWQFRDVAGLFLVSLALAAAARPPIDFLTGRRVPLVLAILLAYGAVVVVIVGVFFAVSAPMVSEVKQAADRIVVVYERISTQWPAGSLLQQLIAQRLPPMAQVLRLLADTQGGQVVATALGATLSVADVVSKAALTLVLSIYWGADRIHFERLWLSVLPVEQRARARRVWRAVEAGVGAYIRSELIQAALAFLLLGLGFTAMGVPYSLMLSFGGALAWSIPLLGGALAIVPVLAVGLLSSPLLGTLSCLYAAAVFVVLELVVEPRFFKRRRYNSIMSIITVIAMTEALGVAGLLVAPPLAVAIQILYRELAGQPATAAQEPEVAGLYARLAEVRGLMAEMGEGASPELLNLVARLESLVDEARGAGMPGSGTLAWEATGRVTLGSVAEPSVKASVPRLPG